MYVAIFKPNLIQLTETTQKEIVKSNLTYPFGVRSHLQSAMLLLLRVLNEGNEGHSSGAYRPLKAKFLCTDQELIPARNVQDFVVNDDLLLPILKTFAQRSRSPHATRNV